MRKKNLIQCFIYYTFGVHSEHFFGEKRNFFEYPQELLLSVLRNLQIHAYTHTYAFIQSHSTHIYIPYKYTPDRCVKRRYTCAQRLKRFQLKLYC